MMSGPTVHQYVWEETNKDLMMNFTGFSKWNDFFPLPFTTIAKFFKTHLESFLELCKIG